MNNLFLTPKNRVMLDELLNLLAPVCAGEARYALDHTANLEPLYELVYKSVKECMDVLHYELYKR
jgi:hypothetical protein